ncbi:MAG: hypothetical protein ABJH08_04310 [Balneola sp.]
MLTNSQIFYDLDGPNSYPRIHFFGRMENSSKDTTNITLENRFQVTSHENQFLWFLESDTLKLIVNSFSGRSEGKFEILPDSTFLLVLVTGYSAFWDENRKELSDSTFYKNLLRKSSTEGKIYFVEESGNRILMERKEPFHIIEGYQRLPSAH